MSALVFGRSGAGSLVLVSVRGWVSDGVDQEYSGCARGFWC